MGRDGTGLDFCNRIFTWAKKNKQKKLALKLRNQNKKEILQQ